MGQTMIGAWHKKYPDLWEDLMGRVFLAQRRKDAESTCFSLLSLRFFAFARDIFTRFSPFLRKADWRARSLRLELRKVDET